MGKSARKLTRRKKISMELSQNGKIIKNKFNKMYNEGAVLVELPACRRMLFIEFCPYFVSLPKVRLFIPYIKTIGEYTSRFVRMCFVQNKNKSILVPPLPNIFYNLKVCCPGASGKTLEDMIAEQAKVLFASQFNCETWETLEEYYYDDFFDNIRCRPEYDDTTMLHKYMNKWMKKTKKNPNWIPNKFVKYNEDDFTNVNP